MEQMPLWGWGLVVFAALLGICWRWLTVRSLSGQITELGRELQVEREQSRGLLRDAARLPDLLTRITESDAAVQRLNEELTVAASKESGACASLHAALDNLSAVSDEKNSTRDERDTARKEINVLEGQLATAIAEKKAAVDSHDQTKQFLIDAQVHLRSAFLEASSRVFDEKAIALDKKISDSATSSQAGLQTTLKPFADKLSEFQVELRKLSGDQATNLSTLVGSINQLQTLNQTMATSTDNLTRALKGNAKTRGDWGEMILETVLKASGLEEGTNFVKQDSNRDEESGRLLRPDVIVNLPDGRQIVVDSKVNLIAWADAHNADSPASYQDALIRHTAALRLHVQDLAKKNYPKALGSNALDLTVMFVPIEGALAAALTVNPELQGEAFGKRVVFASPNTLMAMLRVVERLWTRDKLQRGIEKIKEESQKLLDALSGFIKDFNEIGGTIEEAQKAFSNAKRRLTESDQSVAARAKRLVEAGARGKRPHALEITPVRGVPDSETGADEALDSP